MTIKPAADLGDAGAEAPNLSMHALTGTFADPAHESAFGAQSFRLAFPLHVLLMVLCLAIEAFFVSTTIAATQLLWLVIMHVNLLGLVGRVALHNGMSDPLRAQRLGMWIWTFCVVTASLMDACANVIAPEEICIPTPNRFLR